MLLQVYMQIIQIFLQSVVRQFPEKNHNTFSVFTAPRYCTHALFCKKCFASRWEISNTLLIGSHIINFGFAPYNHTCIRFSMKFCFQTMCNFINHVFTIKAVP